jgi:hypothetical protein
MFYDLLRKIVLGLLVVVLFVSVLAVAFSLVGTWYEDDQAGTALHVTSHIESDPVIIHGYVSTDRASSADDDIHSWFQVVNNGNVQLKGLSFRVRAPGFPDLRFDPVNATIDGNKAVTFSSNTFKPRALEPVKFNITAEFWWTEEGVGQRRRLVTLGPIIFRDPTESRLRLLTRTYVGYLKDLAIPLVIVAVGLWGSGALQMSEVKRTARGLILERVREVAEMHYLFIAATARRVATQLSTLRQKPLANLTENDVHLLTFYVLQLFRHIRDLVNARGGYILHDKDGEEVVAHAQDIYFRMINDNVALMEPRTRAVAHVGSRMDFVEFKDDALPRGAVRDFASELDTWIRGGSNNINVAAAVLRVYAATLSYELNVAYFPFREEWPQLESQDAELGVLDRSGNAEARELARQFRTYSQRQPGRRKRSRR